MMKLSIDGREFRVKEGWTILEVAREHDIPIPTLCYHEEVSPGGRCRLCTVEIVSPKMKRPIVLACLYRVQEGLEVRTQSEGVLRSRKDAMERLLGLAPDAEEIRLRAREIGVEEKPSGSKGRGCILCGLCVRACKEIVGRSALALETQGIRVTSRRCIGCGTCAYLCPTGFIKMDDREGLRVIWNKGFKERERPLSGRFHSPMDWIEYVEETEGMAKRGEEEN